MFAKKQRLFMRETDPTSVYICNVTIEWLLGRGNRKFVFRFSNENNITQNCTSAQLAIALPYIMLWDCILHSFMCIQGCTDCTRTSANLFRDTGVKTLIILEKIMWLTVTPQKGTYYRYLYQDFKNIVWHCMRIMR